MLKVYLLGGLAITLNDGPLVGFISSKAQAAFCYLILNRAQIHLRTSLAAMFWGDMPDEDAATNLRQVIANLKRLLDPYFEITRQSVAFNRDANYWLDVESLEEDHNTELYHGELLAGFGLTDAPEFDTWLSTERERLHDLVLTLLRREASGQQSRGAAEATLATLNRLLVLDPLQEDVHRQLMRTYAVNGQRSSALTQYEKCKDVLFQELGVDPELETTRLYERIRSAQRWSNLPTETAPMIGRETELAELERQLRDPTCHLITIAGLGGIGKTRLALRVGHQCANQTLHGAVLVILTSAQSLDAFLSTLADSIRFSFLQQGAPRAQLIDYLREKHMLLILDNMEQLAGVVNEFLNDLVQLAPDVKIIITSRQRFNLRSEWVLALQGLPSVETRAPNELPAAQTLFLETSRRVRGDDMVRGEPITAINQICSLLHGMPLAIELAAAWSRLLTCEQLAAQLYSNVTALEASTPDNEERHRSLRAVFDHSWRLFSLMEQQILVALSSFVAGFTREAAERVAGASMPLLLGLTDKMLLRRELSGRFSLHEMMRVYLLEKLQGSESVERIRSAYLAYYAALMRHFTPRLKTQEQQKLLLDLAPEIENLHLAWDTAIQTRDTATLMELMAGLSLLHELKSDWRVAQAVLSRAMSVLSQSDAETYGTWLAHMAHAWSRLDQLDYTTDFANRCVGLLSEDNPRHISALARALAALGYALTTRGEHDAALTHLDKALVLRKRAGDDWDLAQCWVRIASAHGQRAQFFVHQGDNQQDEVLRHARNARHAAEQALEISTRIGEQFLTARIRTMLGILLDLEGEIDRAELLQKENLTFYEQISSLDGICMSYNSLGSTAHKRGNFSESLNYFLEALTLARRIGTRVWEANALNNLAVSSYKLNKLYDARSYFRQSQAVFRELGHEQYVGMIQQDIDDIESKLAESAG